MIYLSTIDKYRVDHIDAMGYLRDKVGLYGYAQQDPLIMYKHEAFTKFAQLLATIKQDALAIALRTNFA
jgi:preprotein translocase subunit SecA